ncbi:hypothetical protein F475_02302 [Pseudomonas sp. URMO17WK12:I6]|nr:hypothetical protein F475_02302 [Pseudomonas sp. URMO17WK12:I6]
MIAITSGGPRTTARWQAAVLRAISELMQSSDTAREENQDLRIPFAKALHNLYAGQKSDAELTEMVLLMLEVETAPFIGKEPQPGAVSGDNDL